MPATRYKVHDNGTLESRAIYNIFGIIREGKKDLIRIYLSENEGSRAGLNFAGPAAFCFNRPETTRLEDVVIACIDGLTDFLAAIERGGRCRKKYPLSVKS